jgi:putative FmdB family regulatory protein
MPIYGFECGSCGHRFDRLQKLSDPDPTVCPDCGAEQLRRQLTAPSFRLAGSGWYETDFKKEGDKKRNLVEKGDGAGGSKTESMGSDAKPSSSESASNSKDGKPSAGGDVAASKPAAKPDPASNSKAGRPAPKPASE